MFGGIGSGAFLQDIEVATIAADDTPSTVTPGMALSSERGSQVQVVIGGRIYLIGGDGPSTLSSVDAATVSATSELGAFAEAPIQLATARFGACGAVVGSSVYVLGGNDGTQAIASVERATVAADGSLGSFADSGVALTLPRLGATAAVIGSYLYVGGGNSNGTDVGTTLERAPIAADDSLGPFAAVTDVAFAIGHEFHTSTVIGGFVYEIGGIGASSTVVDRASIAADGTLGAFEVTGHLVASRYEHATTMST